MLFFAQVKCVFALVKDERKARVAITCERREVRYKDGRRKENIGVEEWKEGEV